MRRSGISPAPAQLCLRPWRAGGWFRHVQDGVTLALRQQICERRVGGHGTLDPTFIRQGEWQDALATDAIAPQEHLPGDLWQPTTLWVEVHDGECVGVLAGHIAIVTSTALGTKIRPL